MVMFSVLERRQGHSKVVLYIGKLQISMRMGLKMLAPYEKFGLASLEPVPPLR